MEEAMNSILATVEIPKYVVSRRAIARFASRQTGDGLAVDGELALHCVTLQVPPP
jgi:hypothetical protein